MNFPVVIENEPDLLRTIKSIAKVVASEVAPDDIPLFLSLNDCYRLSRSEVMVKNSIKDGSLKLSVVGGKTVIRKKHFIEWINGKP